MILLTTLAIGREYLDFYRKNFMESHEDYAKRCGYDFHVITYYPEAPFMTMEYPTSYTTISFHKLLVCSQEWSEKYEMILFVDADILISKDAPPLHTAIEYGEKIGIVDEFSQPTYLKRIGIQKNMGWETSGQEYYSLCGLNLNSDHILNTGVLVLQPQKHRAFLESIFEKYIQFAEEHPRGFIFEQTVISYELITQNNYVLLPNKFNTIWALYKWDDPSSNLVDLFKQSWFLHFAGRVDIEKAASLYNSSFKE